MPSVTAAGDTTVIALAPDTIIIRSAELVLRKVELKRSDAVSCDSVEGNGDCEEFETGATLVTLPLGSTAIAQDVAISAPAGTFDGLEFEIHKPSGGDDAAFIAANPDFANISIRVTGTFVHGTGSGAGTRSDFTFTSDVDQSEEQILNPPVTVADGQTINVTLRVDISTWFLNDAKTALVDPASANNGGANESIVANNIQNSLRGIRGRQPRRARQLNRRSETNGPVAICGDRAVLCPLVSSYGRGGGLSGTGFFAGGCGFFTGCTTR